MEGKCYGILLLLPIRIECLEVRNWSRFSFIEASFPKLNQNNTKFLEMTLHPFNIISVKFQIKLLSVFFSLVSEMDLEFFANRNLRVVVAKYGFQVLRCVTEILCV